MNGKRPAPPIIDAETLRKVVSFEDLIDPVGEAFRQSSAGRAENGLVVTFPAETREAGDVYVKTGVLWGHRVFVTKVSPWFAANVVAGRPQGGFMAVFDAMTGHTLAILDEQHYLSDIRTAAAGAVAARTLCPREVHRVAVLGTGDRRATRRWLSTMNARTRSSRSGDAKGPRRRTWRKACLRGCKASKFPRLRTRKRQSVQPTSRPAFRGPLRGRFILALGNGNAPDDVIDLFLGLRGFGLANQLLRQMRRQQFNEFIHVGT